MINIHENILPASPARPGKKLRAFAGVTIHETGNYSAGANARNHMIYMTRNGGSANQCSYHYVVDEAEVYHLIPDDEVAWHAGDGAKGKGNNETIAVEICVNPDGSFEQAVKNAAYLTAALLHERLIRNVDGWVFEHHDFSTFKKNCPALLRAGRAGGMKAFRLKAQEYLDEMWGPADEGEAEQKPAASKLYRVQTGAFSSESAAKAYAQRLRDMGIQCIVKDGGV